CPRGDRPHRRQLRVRRVQGALWHDPGHRFRPHLGLSRRDPGQQRGAVLGERAQGRPLHRARVQAEDPADLPAEHLRLHGRREVRGRRHRQGWRQAGDRRGLRRGSEVHRADRRLLRGRQLRHVRAGLFAAVPVDLAQQPDQRHGRRAGGQCPRHRPPRRRQVDAGAGGGLQGPDPPDLRGRRQPLFRHRAAVGRRRHRPGPDPRCAGPLDLRLAQRADPGDALRRVSDVAMATGDNILEAVTADTVATEAKRAAKYSLPLGTPCPNCKTTLAGAWCYNCGQRGEEYHRSIWKLTWEAIEGLVDLDGRIWQTFPRLILRPGKLTRDYLDGHRAVQVPPFRIFLIVLLMVFFAGTLDISRNGEKFKLAAPNSPDAAKVLTPEMRKNMDIQLGDATASNWLKERLTYSLDHQDAFFAAVVDWGQKFAVLMLPIAALMLSVLFLFKRNVYVYDHLIFSMHSLSFQGL